MFLSFLMDLEQESFEKCWYSSDDCKESEEYDKEED